MAAAAEYGVDKMQGRIRIDTKCKLNIQEREKKENANYSLNNNTNRKAIT